MISFDLFPYIFVGIIPALLNLMTSLETFLDECNQLPFFCFWKHKASFVWCFLQIALPFIAYWLLFSVDKKPAIDGFFCLKAGLFGIGFFGFVNTTPQLGPISIPIKSCYTVLVKIPMLWILNDEAGRTTEFWNDLRMELSEASEDNVSAGIYFLDQYISTSSSFNKSLNDDDRNKLTREYKSLVDTARRKKTNDSKASAIVSVFKQVVRRKDLPRGLRAFGCQKVLREYFTSS